MELLQMLAGCDARNAGHVQITTCQLHVLQCAELKQRLKAACNFLVKVHLLGAQQAWTLTPPISWKPRHDGLLPTLLNSSRCSRLQCGMLASAER
jgi:hypothetical protein